MPQPEEALELLSVHLRWYIEDSDAEGAEDLADRSFVEKLVRTATSSLEGFAPAQSRELISFWQNNPDHWKWAVDDFYSRQAVSDLPDIVRRFLRLSPALVGRIPSAEVSTYLREATRCFLHGFFQGSIALSRAALEAGINEHLAVQLGTVPRVDLIDKLRHVERSGVLNPQLGNDAHVVRKLGGAVLHKSPGTENAAYDALVKTRTVLTKLYQR